MKQYALFTSYSDKVKGLVSLDRTQTVFHSRRWVWVWNFRPGFQTAGTGLDSQWATGRKSQNIPWPAGLVSSGRCCCDSRNPPRFTFCWFLNLWMLPGTGYWYPSVTSPWTQFVFYLTWSLISIRTAEPWPRPNTFFFRLLWTHPASLIFPSTLFQGHAFLFSHWILSL